MRVASCEQALWNHNSQFATPTVSDGSESAMQVVAVGNLGRGFVRDAGQEQYHCVQHGDVKAALARKDAGGWYVLDGRALTALPPGARAVAQALGLASTLTCPAWLDKSGTWLVYLGL